MKATIFLIFLFPKEFFLLFENKLQVIELLSESYYRVFVISHHIFVDQNNIDLFHDEFHHFDFREFLIRY
jgi:hypothetical protein